MLVLFRQLSEREYYFLSICVFNQSINNRRFI